MPRGRRLPPLTLMADERETLERWARRPKTKTAQAVSRVGDGVGDYVASYDSL